MFRLNTWFYKETPENGQWEDVWTFSTRNVRVELARRRFTAGHNVCEFNVCVWLVPYWMEPGSKAHMAENSWRSYGKAKHNVRRQLTALIIRTLRDARQVFPAMYTEAAMERHSIVEVMLTDEWAEDDDAD